jgi:hypothetical protein
MEGRGGGEAKGVTDPPPQLMTFMYKISIYADVPSTRVALVKRLDGADNARHFLEGKGQKHFHLGKVS